MIMTFCPWKIFESLPKNNFMTKNEEKNIFQSKNLSERHVRVNPQSAKIAKGGIYVGRKNP